MHWSDLVGTSLPPNFCADGGMQALGMRLVAVSLISHGYLSIL